MLTEPSAEDVRGTAREVFGRDEFQRTKSPITRFLEWLSDLIQRLLERLFPGDRLADAPGGSGLAQLLAYLFIFLLVVALVALLYYVIRRAPSRRRRTARDAEGVTVEVEELRSVSEWRSLAEQWEQEGRWKDALRARYRELVRSLVDAKVLPPVPGRTTRELCADLESTRPDLLDPFDEATRLFELAWYADDPTGPAENRRFRELARVVIDGAARPTRIAVTVAGSTP